MVRAGGRCGLLLVLLICSSRACADMPRVMSDRYKLELIAQDPEIVTPVGMAFDTKGRLLVVESHTHKRPADYQGPDGDRIRMLSDSDGDGKLDHWSTFADGFLHVMNLLVRSDGGVYVLSRHEVVLIRDTDRDGRADEKKLIVHLETEDDYPHNGLGGIAQLKDGSLLLCLGENHGFAFTLNGSDGTKLSGTGGLDGVIRATADGGQLEWLAHGVWNPFSIGVDPLGRMFAVDNDPDASPPCRLLHIVPGGDYGYLFQYGRSGTHPLQAWNGELPGTLPMVCGVGEAPTAIVAHAGSLWVTSWGDHRLEKYRLAPRGASFGAEREIIVQGNADFRPTGLAAAPDGTLYFGDWELRDYEVHGRGRLWRLTVPDRELSAEFPKMTDGEGMAYRVSLDKTDEGAVSDDPFLRTASARALSRRDPGTIHVSKQSRHAGVTFLQAHRLRQSDDAEPILRKALADSSAEVRLYAVRWIADERITALRDDVAKLLDGELPNPRYYLAVLGAVDWLDRQFDAATTRGVSEELLVRELENPNRPLSVHTLALRLLPPTNKYLTIERLRDYLDVDYLPLQLEAVRSLAQSSSPRRFGLLESTVRDVAQPTEVRVEALVGLSGAADHGREVLESFAEESDPDLQREAQRLLRLAGIRPVPADTLPAATNLAVWNVLLAEPGDAESGRRLFFSPVGPRCSVCHQFDGRGGTIGPDLSNIGQSNSRDRIIASILQPSREIAPHYQPWILTTADGKTVSGLRLAKGGDDGIEPYADAEGRKFTLASKDVEARVASPVSIMPDGLDKTLSLEDLRDLVTFLSDPPEPSK
jgi:putative membrane-bound dehydrogenase-like protein